MRAVIMRGGQLVVEDIDEPVPSPGQVLIAPHATGICGSDLHAREVLTNLAEQMPDATLEMVPGHEFAGEVMAIGADTSTELVVGDLVTAIPFTSGPTGPETIGLSPNFSGSLAEYTLADAARTFRLPEGLDTRLGALTEPVTVAVHAFNRRAAAGPIVVVGAGPIGLGIIAVAAVEQRHPIIVVEPSVNRRAMALHLGADAAYEPGTPLADLLAETGYTQATISPLLDADPVVATVFECVGRPAIVQQILAEAPAHSRVVLAGACSQPVEIQPLQLTTTEVTVETSYAYRPYEFSAAAQHLRDHTALFSQLITSERSLAETAAAFDDLATQPDEIKILIRPTE